MTPLRQATRLIRALLVRLEIWFGGLALLLLLGLTLGQIIARNVFDSGIPGADLLPRHLVLYITFMGAALASDAGRHIRVDALAAWMPDAWCRRLHRPLQATGLVVTALLAQAAWRFWWDEWTYAAEHERFQVLMDLIVPGGFALLAVHFLIGLILGPESQPGTAEDGA